MIQIWNDSNFKMREETTKELIYYWPCTHSPDTTKVHPINILQEKYKHIQGPKPKITQKYKNYISAPSQLCGL